MTVLVFSFELQDFKDEILRQAQDDKANMDEILRQAQDDKANMDEILRQAKDIC